MGTVPGVLGDALRELEDLLAAYDRANRLVIDAVYAQFSPTLDDFYAEELRIEFPDDRSMETPAPEIVLTRTVPGLDPRLVRGRGAPFPLGRAKALVCAALAATARPAACDVLARIEAGGAWLVPAQEGCSQVVRLRLMPDSRDALALVASLRSAF
jgi:hypothetical protein